MSEKAEGYKSGVARRLRFTEQSLGRPVFQMDRLGGGGIILPEGHKKSFSRSVRIGCFAYEVAPFSASPS